MSAHFFCIRLSPTFNRARYCRMVMTSFATYLTLYNTVNILKWSLAECAFSLSIMVKTEMTVSPLGFKGRIGNLFSRNCKSLVTCWQFSESPCQEKEFSVAPVSSEYERGACGTIPTHPVFLKIGTWQVVCCIQFRTGVLLSKSFAPITRLKCLGTSSSVSTY